MIEACERILMHAGAGADSELMDPQGSLRGAILYEFMVLGEAAKHVPDPLRNAHPEVPWQDMAGMRDKIVHYYFGLSDEMVLLAIRDSVPRVLPLLREIGDRSPPDGR